MKKESILFGILTLPILMSCSTGKTSIASCKLSTDFPDPVYFHESLMDHPFPNRMTEKEFRCYRSFKTYFDVAFSKNYPYRFYNLFNAHTDNVSFDDLGVEAPCFEYSVGVLDDEAHTSFISASHAVGKCSADGCCGHNEIDSYFFPVKKGIEKLNVNRKARLKTIEKSGYIKSGKYPDRHRNFRCVYDNEDVTLISISAYIAEGEADVKEIEDYYYSHLIDEGNPYIEEEGRNRKSSLTAAFRIIG